MLQNNFVTLTYVSPLVHLYKYLCQFSACLHSATTLPVQPSASSLLFLFFAFPLLCRHFILLDTLLLPTTNTLHSDLYQFSPYRSDSSRIFTVTPTTQLLFFCLSASSKTTGSHHYNSLCSLSVTSIMPVKPLLNPFIDCTSNTHSL